MLLVTLVRLDAFEIECVSLVLVVQALKAGLIQVAQLVELVQCLIFF